MADVFIGDKPVVTPASGDKVPLLQNGAVKLALVEDLPATSATAIATAIDASTTAEGTLASALTGNATTAAALGAGITVLSGGTGAVARNVQAKASDWLHAADWGGTNTVIGTLLAHPGTRSGQQIITSGFWAPRLGAGGLWVWDATSTATHNYATIVKPTDTSGAGRWHKLFSGPMSVRDFGAIGDGTSRPLSTYFATLGEAQAVFAHAAALTDEVDWAGIQAAVNWHTNPASPTNQRGGSLLLDGCFMVNRTITISQKGLILQGLGWGVTYATDKASFIRWTASSGGVPMINVDEGWGTSIRDIRLIGKSTAKPSAAIQFNEDMSPSGVLEFCSLSHVWIGSHYGYDIDDAQQFERGIYFPAGLQADTMIFEMVIIQKCGTGFECENNQAAFQIRGMSVYFCDIGIKTNVVTFFNYLFLGNNTLDISLPSGGKIIAEGLGSESSTRFCLIEGNFTMLKLHNFAFNIVGDKYNTDGVLIDIQNYNSWLIDLEHCPVYYTGGYSGSPATIKIKNTAGGLCAGRLRVWECEGMWPATIDAGSSTVWTNDHSRVIEYKGFAPATQDPAIISTKILDHHRTRDRAFLANCFDITGRVSVFGGNLFVNSVGAPQVVSAAATGGSGTTYSYKVTAVTNDGESLPSSAATCSGGATLGVSVYNTITWHCRPGAIAYKIYGRTSGSELLIATVTIADTHNATNNGSWSYRDTGSVSPSGALPTLDTTGAVVVENYVRVGGDSGPIIGGGTGAPTMAWPNGSQWRRTDGAAGSTVYERIDGAWTATA